LWDWPKPLPVRDSRRRHGSPSITTVIHLGVGVRWRRAGLGQDTCAAAAVSNTANELSLQRSSSSPWYLEGAILFVGFGSWKGAVKKKNKNNLLRQLFTRAKKEAEMKTEHRVSLALFLSPS
jgi:hypothetical protein